MLSHIDFSITGLCTENLRSQRTPTPQKIKIKNCKFRDWVIRIELNRTILMPLFSNILKNSIVNFRKFIYLVTCFLRVMVSLLCRLQAVLKIHIPIYSYIISEGRRNFSTLSPTQQRNRDSQETCYIISKQAKMDGHISLKI